MPMPVLSAHHRGSVATDQLQTMPLAWDELDIGQQRLSKSNGFELRGSNGQVQLHGDFPSRFNPAEAADDNGSRASAAL